jgi:nucleoside-triphosphatase
VTSSKRLLLLTGRPSIGKTSVLLRAANDLQKKGYRIGGMISHEVREGGIRVGFEIVDFCTGKRGWLAHVDHPTGPKVSKYRVNISDLNAVGASSVLSAVADDDIIVVDEIGPMELHSQAFRDAIAQAIESAKPLLGTIHYQLDAPLIERIKTREDLELLEVTHENRATLHKTIIEKVVAFLEKARD